MSLVCGEKKKKNENVVVMLCCFEATKLAGNFECENSASSADMASALQVFKESLTHNLVDHEGLPKSKPFVGASKGLATILKEMILDLIERLM